MGPRFAVLIVPKSYESFHGDAVPSFVSIASNLDLVMVSDKLISHKSDEKLPPPKIILYKWRQNVQDLIIFIELEKRPIKDDISIQIERFKLKVKVKIHFKTFYGVPKSKTLFSR